MKTCIPTRVPVSLTLGALMLCSSASGDDDAHQASQAAAITILADVTPDHGAVEDHAAYPEPFLPPITLDADPVLPPAPILPPASGEPSEPAERPPLSEQLDTDAAPASRTLPDLSSRGPLDITFLTEPIRSRWHHRTYLYREDNDGLQILPRGSGGMGLTTLGFYFGVAPDTEKQTHLWFDPRFEWTFVNGPHQPHLPPQLYELSLGVNLSSTFRDLWELHLHVAPTWATDWDNKSSDAFRTIGGGIFACDLSEEWKLLAGAMVLDRPDLPVLPHGGVLWRPEEDIEIDLMIPRPRAALRLSQSDDVENWFYVAGNVGGGSWAYERPDNFKDRVSYLDLRVVAGFEHRVQLGLRSLFEVGYVFERRLDLDRQRSTINLPGTVVFRWASDF